MLQSPDSGGSNLSKHEERRKKGVVISGDKAERKSIRWLMVVYDSILYGLCWLVFFGFHPSLGAAIPTFVSCLYLAVGYVLFFGFRFLLRCYNQIWRYGMPRPFLKEIVAGVMGGLLLIVTELLLENNSKIESLPFVFVVSFAAVYILLTLVVRIMYWKLYRFAEKENKVSKLLRFLLEHLAFVDFNSKKPGGTLQLVLVPEKQVAGPINEVQRVIDCFAIRGEVTKITQINKGYINRTYKVETLSDTGHVHKYTLQRINNKVFPDVDTLMENFKLTTDHLHGKFRLPGYDKRGSVQTLRPTKDGCAYLKDPTGCWRMMTFFEDVYSLDIPDSPKTFYHAGHAFGTFLKEMSDVDIEDIHEVIPNFHNTKSRYLDLEKSIAADPKGRVKDVLPEIEFVRKRADKYGIISDALESGKIPTRICHNDCNLNNILFDNKTHMPVAIIDLDTVMPSSPLYDYGDSMRIGTNTATDDEKDLSKVSCDLNLYEQYARGYLKACGDILTKEELELLPYASLIITSEDGIRFLMDHIDGDTYYNIYYPGQNLDRSRTQLKLVEDMEKKLPQIKDILRRIYAELGLQAEIT